MKGTIGCGTESGDNTVPLAPYSEGAAHEVSGKTLGKRENFPAYFVRGSPKIWERGKTLPPNLSRTPERLVTRESCRTELVMWCMITVRRSQFR